MPRVPTSAKSMLIISLIACYIALYCQFHNQLFVDAQLRHSVLLQKLNNGSDSILDKSRALLNNSKGLTTLKSLHDTNIVVYQSIIRGNLKQDLTSAGKLTGQDTGEMESSFARFSNLVSQLIQSRAQLLQLENMREEAKIGARTLAEKGTNLAIGIRQFGATKEQTYAAYDLALQLNDHYLSVVEVFTGSGTYQPLNASDLAATLNHLSSGPNAAKSAILRRSAAQLLTDIDSFSENSELIAEHQALQQSIGQQIESIEQAKTTLSLDISTVKDIVISSSSAAFPISIITWFLSVATAVGACLQTSRHNPVSNPDNTASLPEPASELTSSYFLNQIKTDKNKLISDIRPLADGILYLHADEHLESTGDIAKCFNRSREALVDRIESLRTLASNIQSELEKAPESHKSPQAKIQLNTTPIEDLTFKAQSELEGIIRRVRNQRGDESATLQDSSPRELLIRCQRADRIMDEIRIRVRKGLQETLDNVVNELSATADSKPNQAVSNLIVNLVSNLDELQTQAPSKARRKTQ